MVDLDETASFGKEPKVEKTPLTDKWFPSMALEGVSSKPGEGQNLPKVKIVRKRKNFAIPVNFEASGKKPKDKGRMLSRIDQKTRDPFLGEINRH